MKVTEILGGKLEAIKEDPYQVLDGFSIWTTNEERKLLKKLTEPVKIANLSEHEQFIVQGMIRKSLLTKVGHINPSVVANEKTN